MTGIDSNGAGNGAGKDWPGAVAGMATAGEVAVRGGCRCGAGAGASSARGGSNEVGCARGGRGEAGCTRGGRGEADGRIGQRDADATVLVARDRQPRGGALEVLGDNDVLPGQDAWHKVVWIP